MGKVDGDQLQVHKETGGHIPSGTGVSEAMKKDKSAIP